MKSTNNFKYDSNNLQNNKNSNSTQHDMKKYYGLIVIVVIVLLVIIIVVVTKKQKKSVPAKEQNGQAIQTLQQPQKPVVVTTSQPIPAMTSNLPTDWMTPQLKREHVMDASFLTEPIHSGRVGTENEAVMIQKLKMQLLQDQKGPVAIEAYNVADGYNIDSSPLYENPQQQQQEGQNVQHQRPLGEIDAVNFEKFEQGVANGLVLFHMLHCPMCIEMKPRLQKVSDVHPEQTFALFADSVSQPFWKKYNIASFPTLYKFRNGNATLYKGNWKIEDIHTFASS